MSANGDILGRALAAEFAEQKARGDKLQAKIDWYVDLVAALNDEIRRGAEEAEAALAAARVERVAPSAGNPLGLPAQVRIDQLRDDLRSAEGRIAEQKARGDALQASIDYLREKLQRVRGALDG